MQNLKINRKGTCSLGIILALLLAFAAIAGIYDFIIPDEISVYSGSDRGDILGIPMIKLVQREPEPVQMVLSDAVCTEIGVTTTERQASLFGVIPVKKVEVSVYDRLRLCPGGMPFGVKLYTRGVIVIGITDINIGDKTVNPAAEAGLQVRDVIVAANNNEVNTADEVTSLIENSGGAPLKLVIERNGERRELILTPRYAPEDNKYKAGIWIRDSTAGIGTVTFVNPDNNAFAGLGHGICDVDTGSLMPLLRGTVTDVTISGITKGKAGAPGELKGYFNAGKAGSLIGNTEAGVYGLLSDIGKLSADDALQIALRDEVHEGDATLRCTLGDNGIGTYTAKIEKINPNENDLKNFVIRITDPALLEATGGIVQGMSGSPVIQDGKLIGAVTHVLINEPHKGYGIFIENMLKNMSETIS